MTPQVNGDEWRNALDGMEHRLERQMRLLTQPIADDVKDVKALQQTANGRIGRLEEDRVRRDTEDRVRAELAKSAVELVATRAADAIRVQDERRREREWGARKLSTAIAGAGVLIAALSFLASLLAHSIS